MDLAQKNILLTGASRGIGLSLAQECAKRKAHLHLVSRKLDSALIQPLLDLGAASVHLWEFDLSQTSEVEELVKSLNSKSISIDVLINNAGLLTGGLLEKQDPDSIDKMLNVNVHALIRLTSRLLPGMLARKQGLIINNASVSGKMFFPCASTYAASKAAVVAFTESLKQELRGTGVSTLLMITPGVKTDMFDDISKLYGKHLDVSFLSHIPVQEWSQKVVQAIEEGKTTVWPSGASRFGVALAHHWPSLFEKIVRTKFNRYLK